MNILIGDICPHYRADCQKWLFSHGTIEVLVGPPLVQSSAVDSGLESFYNTARKEAMNGDKQRVNR